MVKSKVCVGAISILMGIELMVAGILLFALGNNLIESTVKKV
jgi:hypothetical protein